MDFMNDSKEFKPYIPDDKITPEITVSSVIIGIILSVVFGAANAYLGLRVGMTVSASIPAAVIGMGVIRVIMKKNSVLENNIVQTIGSAGESVAAGSIFTLPALFLWASEGKMQEPSIITITFIALLGGLLGVFFMIPLRNALIVREHYSLPYPEGKACAEVLLAGEKKGSNAITVFAGMGVSALFKFIIDGIRAVPGEISFRVKGFAGEIGTQIYPAVLSVGYICGPKIASYMFAGGVLSWLVLIPMIVFFGADTVISPSVNTVSEVYSEFGASGIWSNYVRYIGAGTLAAGGIISLVKSLPIILRTFKDSLRVIGKKSNNDKRTDRDINLKIVFSVLAILTIFIWLVPAVPVSFFGALIIVVFGFFFSTVSSRMVGLVGGSNNPVSGMAIATLLISTLVLKLTGTTGSAGLAAAISIGSIICIVAAISGDTSQDLKTGFLLGATPWKQQVCEIIGVVSSSLAIGGTLYLLNTAWGFGTDELAAPQATLMKMITEGVMDGNLPWILVFTGVFVAVVAELSSIPVLPFAIGVYLPVHLNACIMVGGLVRLLIERRKNDNANREEEVNRGVLYCSGMIAGEGLVGILLAVFSLIPVGVKTLADYINISSIIGFSEIFSGIFSIVLFVFVIVSLVVISVLKKGKRS